MTKSEKRLRTHIISVRMTDEELEAVRAAAPDDNLSTFIRDSILFISRMDGDPMGEPPVFLRDGLLRDAWFTPGNDKVWGAGNWVKCTELCAPDSRGLPVYHHKSFHQHEGVINA